MIDLAIYIALKEELESFLAVWPEPTLVSEEPGVNFVSYQFEIQQRGTDVKFFVVVACPGAMGTERAAAVASSLITSYKPRYFASIGISGAVSTDISLGDVVVPKRVWNYLANAAVVDSANAAGWEYQLSGNMYDTDQRFLVRLNNFSATYASMWKQRFQNTFDAIDERQPGFLRAQAEAGIVSLPPKLHSEEIVLASGPAVAKSESFLNWLKSIDRKAAAIDMEAAGILELSNLHPHTGFVVIRGISDFADARKSKTERETRGEFRRLAMENCSTLLLSSVEGGLFSTDSLHHPVKASNLTCFKPDFEAFLESTEVIFQHPHKDKLCLSDIFVFPDLAVMAEGVSSVRTDLENSGFLLNTKALKPRTAIFGYSQAGKTSLAKTLTKQYFSQGLIPVLLSGSKIRNADIRDPLRAQLRFQFGDELKLESIAERLVVIIDDFEQIRLNKRVQLKIFDELDGIAHRVIVFIHNEARLATTNLIQFDSFSKYTIMRFGHMKRSELIRRWISVGRQDEISNAELLAKEDELTLHINSIIRGNLLPPRPFYLVVTLQTVETTKTTPGQQLTSYGHCYQAVIVQALHRSGVPIDELDAHLNYLSELAYSMHRNRSSRLNQAQMTGFEKCYAEKYIFSHSDNTLEKSMRAGVLRVEGENVFFGQPFMQYFFCARFLAENFESPEVKAAVEKITGSIYLEQHAKIAVFLTHHSKSQIILDWITLAAMACFESIGEATLHPEETTHFKAYDQVSSAIVLEQREAEGARKQRLEAMDRRDVSNVYDCSEDAPEAYDEVDEPNTLFADMHASFRAVELIGQVLRNRYGSFRRDQLEIMAEEAIRVGLRALKQHQILYAENREVIVEIVQELLREETDETDTEIARRAQDVYLSHCYWVSFAFLEKISEMLGYKRLIEIFETLLNGQDRSTAMKLIMLSMKLNAEKVVPRALLEELIRKGADDPVCGRLVRQMVVRFLYLNETSLKDREWLVTKLNLPTGKRKQLLISKMKAKRQ